MKSHDEILKFLEKDEILTQAIKKTEVKISPELDIDIYF